MPESVFQRDHSTAAFLEGTRRGEFLLVKDTQTGEILPPQFDDSIDPQRYIRVPANGSGWVVSWSIVHRPRPDGAVDRLPVGIVELDEGCWWWTSLPDADPDADLFGLRVQVAHQVLNDSDGESIPYFRLV
jgi:uncharacterized OB-fold protein